jgi:hypothetical protein
MKLATAKAICRDLGFTLLKRDGEFIVKVIGSTVDDVRTYFKNDLDDAVGTAKAMSLTGAKS